MELDAQVQEAWCVGSAQTCDGKTSLRNHAGDPIDGTNPTSFGIRMARMVHIQDISWHSCSSPRLTLQCQRHYHAPYAVIIATRKRSTMLAGFMKEQDWMRG
jgi:hypothetical protein